MLKEQENRADTFFRNLEKRGFNFIWKYQGLIFNF